LKLAISIDDDKFCISITGESDWSTDGGYTFEDVTNTHKLEEAEARDLLSKLEEYFRPAAGYKNKLPVKGIEDEA